MLRPAEAARQLGVRPWRMYELLAGGVIPSCRYPSAGGRGALRVSQAGLDAFRQSAAYRELAARLGIGAQQ
jgi:hypothetical protein